MYKLRLSLLAFLCVSALNGADGDIASGSSQPIPLSGPVPWAGGTIFAKDSELQGFYSFVDPSSGSRIDSLPTKPFIDHLYSCVAKLGGDVVELNEEIGRVVSFLSTSHNKELESRCQAIEQDGQRRVENLGKDLGSRLENLGKDLGNLERRAESLGKGFEHRVESLGKDLVSLGKDLVSLGNRVEGVEKDLGNLGNRVGNLENRVENLGKDLGNRVENIERRVGDIEDRFQVFDGIKQRFVAVGADLSVQYVGVKMVADKFSFVDMLPKGWTNNEALDDYPLVKCFISKKAVDRFVVGMCWEFFEYRNNRRSNPYEIPINLLSAYSLTVGYDLILYMMPSLADYIETDSILLNNVAFLGAHKALLTAKNKIMG